MITSFYNTNKESGEQLIASKTKAFNQEEAIMDIFVNRGLMNMTPSDIWHLYCEEFKDVYIKGWKGKLKGVTTFRLAGKRYGILNKSEPATKEDEGAACFIDPATGQKECG